MPNRLPSIYFVSYVIFFVTASVLYFYELFISYNAAELDNSRELNTTVPVLSVLFFVLSIICGWFELFTILL